MRVESMHAATAIVDSMNGDWGSACVYKGPRYSRKPRRARGSRTGRM
jgi:hypothetical protein